LQVNGNGKSKPVQAWIHPELLELLKEMKKDADNKISISEASRILAGYHKQRPAPKEDQYGWRW